MQKKLPNKWAFPQSAFLAMTVADPGTCHLDLASTMMFADPGSRLAMPAGINHRFGGAEARGAGAVGVWRVFHIP